MTNIVDNSNQFLPKTILAVAAHADDLEFCIGGSIAHWAAAGASVYFLILTNGNRGTADHSLSPAALSAMRRKEQSQAAHILGVKEVFFKDYDDCNLTVSESVKRDIVRVIREVKPDTVITMDPTMVYSVGLGMINHTDHRAAGQATLDAVYPLARDHLSFPELALEPHAVATVLLTNFNKATFYLDITDTIDTKVASLKAHASQFPDIEDIISHVRDIAKNAGSHIKCPYAEGFIKIDIR